jgi:PAS domain S-box-containing protein
MTQDDSAAKSGGPDSDKHIPYPPAVSSEEAARLRDEVQAKLAAIVESSDDAIISKTLDGLIRTWNAGATRIFGYTADEVIGKSILILIPAGREHEEPSILQRLRRGERVDHFETVRRSKDGRLIDVSVTISPIRDSSGTIIGASKIARDITLQKRFENELRAAKEEAETAGRAKDEFLSVLSHELRTPLTPVLAALSFLESRHVLPEELRAEIEMIRRNVETEARLVDDLLDLTRIARGKMELHFEIVDAHGAARGALNMLQAEIDAKKLEVSLALRAKDHHVWADPGRLQQILLNILSNALKFTPEGGTIAIRSENPAGSQLVIEVRDTGIGIDPASLPRLFNAFEQGEQGRIRRYGGLGLGLSIARALAEMHKGEVLASSEGLGRGASFMLGLGTVPSHPASAKAGAAPAATVISTCRVLLVEDHDDTRQVMSRLLASFGCTVRSAANVAEAVALADNELFDVLVSDIGLPDGTGMDVMRHMRTRHKIKGVAVSGFGQADDLQRSRDAGFEMHLIKPVNFHMLQNVIEKVSQ